MDYLRPIDIVSSPLAMIWGFWFAEFFMNQFQGLKGMKCYIFWGKNFFHFFFFAWKNNFQKKLCIFQKRNIFQTFKFFLNFFSDFFQFFKTFFLISFTDHPKFWRKSDKIFEIPNGPTFFSGFRSTHAFAFNLAFWTCKKKIF